MKRYTPFLLILMLLMAACGDDPKEQEAKEVRDAEMTLQAIPPVGTIVPGCQVAELENWYEIVSINAQIFQDEARTFADLGADSAPAALDRLIELEDGLMTVTVPECMSDVNTLIHTIMQTMIEDFRQYSSGTIQQGEIQERTRLARERYDSEVRPILEQTQAQLNQRLQEGN